LRKGATLKSPRFGRFYGAMLDALFDCNRKVNLVFGVCVDVQNVAAPLAGASFNIELLAHNGVVRAAQLDGIAGRPLIALTEFLSTLPKKIGPAVKEIEQLCRRLARVTADSTNRIRVYYLLTRALLRMAESGLPEEARVRLQALANSDFTTDRDLERLVQLLEEHQVRGAAVVGARCQATLREVSQRIEEARQIFADIDERLQELKTIARSSRYLASCLRIEVAHLPKESDGFGSFTAEIGSTLDLLEERLAELQRIETRGEGLVRDLAERIDSHA
jgi:hypothetical protein